MVIIFETVPPRVTWQWVAAEALTNSSRDQGNWWLCYSYWGQTKPTGEDRSCSSPALASADLTPRSLLFSKEELTARQRLSATGIAGVLTVEGSIFLLLWIPIACCKMWKWLSQRAFATMKDCLLKAWLYSSFVFCCSLSQRWNNQGPTCQFQVVNGPGATKEWDPRCLEYAMNWWQTAVRPGSLAALIE